MALINTTTTGVLGTTVYGDGAGALTVQENGVTINKITKAPSFMAYPTSSQTLSGGTITKIQHNTELWDTDSCYDNTNYRFTPTIAGYYFFVASILPSTTYSGFNYNYLYKNGASALGQPGISTYGMSSISGIVYLNGTTDYVEHYAVFGTGQTTNVGSPTSFYNHFQGILMRAA